MSRSAIFGRRSKADGLGAYGSYKLVHREIKLPGVPREQVIICPHAPMLNIKNHTSESSHIIILSYIYIYRERAGTVIV
jgi:hypothetical protein